MGTVYVLSLQADSLCYAELEEDGLSASAVEKLSKLKVFQHLRDRHKTQQQRVQLPVHLCCALPDCAVSCLNLTLQAIRRKKVS